MAVVSLRRQGPPDDGVDLGRHRLAHRRRRPGIGRCGDRRVGVRRPAGEQEIGERGQGVEVGAGVEALATRLLGRDVGRGARDHGQPRGHVEGLAEAEVGHHRPDLAVHAGTEQDVGRLDVAVQDAAHVQGVQPVTHLADHPQRGRRAQRPELEPIGEGALVGVRHDQERPTVVELAGVVDRHHVRRLDLAQVAPLVDEPLPDVLVRGPVVGQHLDRDVAVELLVVREPHRGEAAGADAATHRVATEARGCGHHCIILQGTTERGAACRQRQ